MPGEVAVERPYCMKSVLFDMCVQKSWSLLLTSRVVSSPLNDQKAWHGSTQCWRHYLNVTALWV